MELGLKGRIALVTGGSKGIGYACAKLLAEEGAKVGIVSRSPEHLAEAKASLAAEGHAVATFAADLRDAAAAARMVEAAEAQLGPLDVLVNSAGAARRYAPETLDAQAYHDTMDAK
jgi:NAD(P)-dependent dehydrogenase (short-subunit alcohol dehydrogenase family)